jgi:hypothetical protein
LDDVAKDLARERLRVELKKATSVRELIRIALSNGTSPEYLSMRYSVPIADILKGKGIWDAQEVARETKRNSVSAARAGT